jgi:hypothetical protein
MSTSTGVHSSEFWERLWRSAGLQFVGFFIVAWVIYGNPPGVGAPADTLVAFYGGDRTRILLGAFFFGLNILNLLWFTAALRTVLADAGQEGWGAAATASSAAFGGLFLLQLTVGTALAYSIAGTGNSGLVSGLNDFAWALGVLIAFPRAMLIMSGTFGLWRAGLISSSLFGAGVAAVILGVLGGSTWLSGGFWAPDGAFSRFVSPILLLLWAAVASRVVSKRSPTRAGW